MSTVNKLVQLSAQVTPRDRLCRLLQYGSKCCWYFGGVGTRPLLTKDLIERLKAMEASISMGRRMLRLGRSLPLFQSALNMVHLSDAIRRISLTMSRIASALYLAIDNLIWLAQVGLLRADVDYWSNLSSRLWLLSILFNLIRDFYEFFCLIEEFRQKDGRHNGELRVKWKALGHHLIEKEQPLLLETVSNMADMFIPMSSLAYVSITPGTVGLMGFFTSIVGLLSVWNPALKMMP